MKIIKVYLHNTLISEGIAEDGEDTVKALEMVAKAFKGVEGVRFEVEDGDVDETVKGVRSRLERPYQVAGQVKVGKYTAETVLDINAVSEAEAIEKAEAEGLINPYIKDYSDYDNDDEEDEDEVDYEECYHCCGHDTDCPWYSEESGICINKVEAEDL